MNLYLLYSRYSGESYDDVESNVVPGQSMSLTELVQRFSNGQRLLVNQRPLNVYPADEDGNYIDSSIHDEDERNVMPDIEDRVDIEEYLEDISAFKDDLNRKSKEKHKEGQQSLEPPKDVDD